MDFGFWALTFETHRNDSFSDYLEALEQGDFRECRFMGGLFVCFGAFRVGLKVKKSNLSPGGHLDSVVLDVLTWKVGR